MSVLIFAGPSALARSGDLLGDFLDSRDVLDWDFINDYFLVLDSFSLCLRSWIASKCSALPDLDT